MVQPYPVLFWYLLCMLSTFRVLATGLLDLDVPMYLCLYLERNRTLFTGNLECCISMFLRKGSEKRSVFCRGSCRTRKRTRPSMRQPRGSRTVCAPRLSHHATNPGITDCFAPGTQIIIQSQQQIDCLFVV